MNNIYFVRFLVAYIFPSLSNTPYRSWACHHPEDGNPRLHAPSHPGDAGELRRSGKWCRRWPDQWCPPRQLQPQFVPQLCPKQSSHTIAVVTAHLFIFPHVALRLLPRRSKEEGWRRGALTLTEPAASSATTQIPTSWSAFPSLRNTVLTWGEVRPGHAGATGCLWETTPLTLLMTPPPSPSTLLPSPPFSKRLTETKSEHNSAAETSFDWKWEWVGHRGTNNMDKDNALNDLTNTRHFFLVLWGRLQAWDLSEDPPLLKDSGSILFFQLQKTDFVQKDI